MTDYLYSFYVLSISNDHQSRKLFSYRTSPLGFILSLLCLVHRLDFFRLASSMDLQFISRQAKEIDTPSACFWIDTTLVYFLHREGKDLIPVKDSKK